MYCTAPVSLDVIAMCEAYILCSKALSNNLKLLEMIVLDRSLLAMQEDCLLWLKEQLKASH